MRSMAGLGVGVTVLLMVVADGAAVRAASGTWNNQNGGSWTNASNWSGGTIADGSGSSANFGTLNLTADAIVTLDVPRTVGSLVFADQAARITIGR